MADPDRTRTGWPVRGSDTHQHDFMPPPPLGHSSLVWLAVEEIRAMILSGELRPGERLKEEQLAVRLNISRSPVREALRLLEGDGLVTVQARRGATVTQLSEADVYEILTLRTALERLAIEQGVPCVTDVRIDRCEHWLGVMEQCAKRKDRAQLVEAGYEFHRAVIGLPGHQRLSQMWDSLHRQLLMCMAMNLYTREHHHEDLVEHVRRHRVLLDLIKAGDPEAVLAELAVHGERSFTEHPKE